MRFCRLARENRYLFTMNTPRFHFIAYRSQREIYRLNPCSLWWKLSLPPLSRENSLEGAHWGDFTHGDDKFYVSLFLEELFLKAISFFTTRTHCNTSIIIIISLYYSTEIFYLIIQQLLLLHTQWPNLL
jgi:hypothetical protein